MNAPNQIHLIGRGLKVVLLGGVGLSVLAIAVPAHAQDAPTSDTPSTAATSKDDEIIVTGSRIARKDYTSKSPTVTVDEKFLQQSSTAAIENQLNKLPQFVVSQSSTAKNNEGGLVPAGGDIQPNSTNTPGAATVSLRGVGANRTLVLLDGRRGTPGNASGTVDISTIPSSALERVDIVSGGASATYGADAVAGVTNFILKKNFQGLQLDAQTGISQYGDGFEYQFSGIVGTNFAENRGNVSLAFSTNKRSTVYERDRPWFRDMWANPSIGGGAFFIGRPGVALQTYTPGTLTGLFPGANPVVPDNATGTIYANSDGTLWVGDTFANRGGAAFLKPSTFAADAFNQYKVTSVGTVADNVVNNRLAVPLTRYNFYGRGNYEINDWIGMFGQAMFSQSSTATKQAPGNITGGWDVDIPWGNGVYVGNGAAPSSVLRNGDNYPGIASLPTAYVDPTPGILSDNPTNPTFANLYRNILSCANNAVGGCTNTQAFEQVIPASLRTLLNNRTGSAQPGDPGYIPGLPALLQPTITQPNQTVPLRAEFPDNRETFTKVTTYNIVAGLQGKIPGTDWTWNLSLNQGESMTSTRQTGIYSLARARAVISAPNFGQGFNYTGNQAASSPGFGASSGTCTTGFDFFNVKGNANKVSTNCSSAIRADLNTKGSSQQSIVEANFQGKLFDLPAGELRGATGASYRKNSYTFINDGLLQKDRSFLDQSIGIYPSGDTIGSITAKEVYAELLVPVLKDLPFVRRLNLELGGRMSKYDTTGTSYTFKALGDWEVTRWLRFRGGFNRAERAPNIAELFLSPQQSFGFDTVGDLCSNVLPHPASANPTTNPTGAADTRAVCEQLMKRDNGGVTPAAGFSYYGTWAAFQPTGPGFSFGSVAGNTQYRNTVDGSIAPLKPEVANTWTAGFVLNSPVTRGPLSRLRMTVDYFNITIKDPIGALSVGAAQQLCLDPKYNSLVVGAAADPAKAAAAITAPSCGFVKRNVDSGFGGSSLNSAAMTTTYRNDGLVKLSGLDASIDWSSMVGPGTLFMNFTGNYMFHFKAKELGPNPLVDYVGTTGTGVKGLNYGAAFRYKVFGTVGYAYKGASLSLQWQHTPETRNYGSATTTTPAVPNYDLFNLNGSYQLTRDIGIRFGVDNLFNKAPPITGVNTIANAATGQLPGGSFSYFTDIQGRRFSLGGSIKF
jgi:outer membrane receptor protein involved in Fe transport